MGKEKELISEISNLTREYKTDSYSISIGELMNLYQNNEIIINPVFQRFFRWTHAQKTKLIESIFLGIPIPSIFVYQREDAIWELVDGLQRISTILQFVGILKSDNVENTRPLILEGTKFVPNFEGAAYVEGVGAITVLPQSLKLEFKRARLNITIIKKESGEDAKYEVFQRLNTGGSFASDQEIRNCIMVMRRPDIFQWLKDLAYNANFLQTLSLTERLMDEQYNIELALRYLSYKYFPYPVEKKKDISDYLTDGMEYFLNQEAFPLNQAQADFEKLFNMLASTLGDKAFKKFEGGRFKGSFLQTAYEAIVIGLSHHIDSYIVGQDEELINNKIKSMWEVREFLDNVSGVNAKARLPRIIPFSQAYFSK